MFDLTNTHHVSDAHIFWELNDCGVGKYKLDWINCKGFTNDGAAVMTKTERGLVKKSKKKHQRQLVLIYLGITVSSTVETWMPKV